MSNILKSLLIAILFIPIYVSANSSLGSGLAGYWPLNRRDYSIASTTASSTIFDRSGNGNSAIGKGTKIAGVIGQAITFNGTTQWLDTGWTTDIYSNATFTISVWVKTTTTGSIQVASKGGCSSGTCQTGWGIQTTGASGWQFVGKPSTFTCTPSTVVDDGKWHLLTGVASTNTSGPNVCSTYTDGVLSSFASGSGSNYAADASNTVQIGHRNQGTFFTGSEEDFRVYNRALSAAEILQLYGSEKGGVANNGTLLDDVMGGLL